ncbi:MAG TPA: aldo/keto reductase [Acidimicrobiia bacterium]|nr:aldo/keto reductase [Acidimicrobiia bacterium]
MPPIRLHTPGPEVPFAESVGALVELREEAEIGHIGLSNVGRTQILQGLEFTPIASVQKGFNLRDRSGVRLDTAQLALLEPAAV